MKIAVTGGHSEAKFIISMFNMKRHELVVVNDDIQFEFDTDTFYE